MILPNTAEVLAAAHAATVEPVEFARQLSGGSLPPARTLEFVDGDVAVRRAVLLVAGLAWLAADPEQVIRARLRETADDVHGGRTTFWRDLAVGHVPHDELQRRRGVTAA